MIFKVPPNPNHSMKFSSFVIWSVRLDGLIVASRVKTYERANMLSWIVTDLGLCLSAFLYQVLSFKIIFVTSGGFLREGNTILQILKKIK